MDTAANSDNGNGRVTLAVLSYKMDEVLRRLDALDKLPERVSVMEQRLDTAECEVEKLRGMSTLWNAGNTLAALIAAALGVRT